jgi:hypothetical protein
VSLELRWELREEAGNEEGEEKTMRELGKTEGMSRRYMKTFRRRLKIQQQSQTSKVRWESEKFAAMFLPLQSLP